MPALAQLTQQCKHQKMKFWLIKIYFKGGVLVPFYISCFFSFISLIAAFVDSDYKMPVLNENVGLYKMLEVTFFSGLAGLCSLTVFLNSFRKIAERFVYSFLSWFLIPCCCIGYILETQIEWAVFRNTKYGNPVLTSYYLVIFFFHFIGLIIGFQSFRATVLRNKNNDEIMNGQDDHSPLNKDADVQESDVCPAGARATGLK